MYIFFTGSRVAIHGLIIIKIIKLIQKNYDPFDKLKVMVNKIEP